jgi:hypothetical protein
MHLVHVRCLRSRLVLRLLWWWPAASRRPRLTRTLLPPRSSSCTWSMLASRRARRLPARRCPHTLSAHSDQAHRMPGVLVPHARLVQDHGMLVPRPSRSHPTVLLAARITLTRSSRLHCSSRRVPWVRLHLEVAGLQGVPRRLAQRHDSRLTSNHTPPSPSSISEMPGLDGLARGDPGADLDVHAQHTQAHCSTYITAYPLTTLRLTSHEHAPTPSSISEMPASERLGWCRLPGSW